MDAVTSFACPLCGAENDVEVDASGGRRQEYGQDCQVCCAPVVLHVRFDRRGRAHVEATPE